MNEPVGQRQTFVIPGESGLVEFEHGLAADHGELLFQTQHLHTPWLGLKMPNTVNEEEKGECIYAVIRMYSLPLVQECRWLGEADPKWRDTAQSCPSLSSCISSPISLKFSV